MELVARARLGLASEGPKPPHPCPLDDRAPTTIHISTPYEYVKPHSPTQSQPPQGKNIEGGHTPEPETTAPQRKQPKKRTIPIGFQEKPRQLRKKPRLNYAPAQRNGGVMHPHVKTPPNTGRNPKNTRKPPPPTPQAKQWLFSS